MSKLMLLICVILCKLCSQCHTVCSFDACSFDRTAGYVDSMAYHDHSTLLCVILLRLALVRISCMAAAILRLASVEQRTCGAFVIAASS
jgi:hypothetical protein